MNPKETTKKIKSLVGEARISEALDLLGRFVKEINNKELENQFQVLKSRNSREDNKYILGVKEGDIAGNNINYAINLFTDRVEKVALEKPKFNYYVYLKSSLIILIPIAIWYFDSSQKRNLTKENITNGNIANESTQECQGENHYRDPRDKQCYKIVKLKGRWWMAENLRFKSNDTDGSFADNLGLKYRWDQAMKACPGGWRLPTKNEWVDLKDSYGDTDENEGSKLAYVDLTVGGKGDFNAYNKDNYWSSTDDNSKTHAWHFYLKADDKAVSLTTTKKMDYLHCRCIKELL